MTADDENYLSLPPSIREKFPRPDRIEKIVREPGKVLVKLTNGATHTYTKQSFWWKLTGVK